MAILIIEGDIMFYIPFWIFFAVSIILAVVTISIRKLQFIDVQIMIMIIAVTMSCDMIFCKQLKLYHYVDMQLQYIGWYSFWANFIICPAFGLVFIKFIPSTLRKVALYIATWTAVLTLFELYIAKPYSIVHYPVWRIIPWSTIGYILVLTWEYIYYKILKKTDINI